MYPRYKVMILMVSVMSIHESGATGDVYFSCYLSGVCFWRGKHFSLHLNIGSSQ